MNYKIKLNHLVFFKQFLLGFCLLLSCSQKELYPGFSVSTSGIYYKLHSIGESQIKAKVNDLVTVHISYSTLKDSVFFKGVRKILVTKPAFKGSIDECFTMISKDDSATFIINAVDFFTKTIQSKIPSFLTYDGYMKVSMRIIDIQTKQQFNKAKEEFLSWIKDFGEYEKTILKHFIDAQELGVAPTPSGMYYIKIKEGTGKKVAIGDTVTVHYEGLFLNGTFFDSTKKRNQPFTFIYGEEWQVIKGLEEAIGKMHEGEKAIVILPSDIAFGHLGSSTGIIPPFTSVIFEVELLEVK